MVEQTLLYSRRVRSALASLDGDPPTGGNNNENPTNDNAVPNAIPSFLGLLKNILKTWMALDEKRIIAQYRPVPTLEQERNA